MRAEGDIANLIMQATIWRRIGIISEAGGGIVLKGHAVDAGTIDLHHAKCILSTVSAG
jgi:thioredoxin reductase (NADPH)